MIVRKILSWLCALIAAVIAAAVIAAAVYCRDAEPVLLQPPEDAVRQVEGLMEAVCSGDMEAAGEFLQEAPSRDALREMEHSLGRPVWDAYVRCLDYVLVGDLYATDTGVAQNVKLIRMELETATQQIGSRARDLLQQEVAQAQQVEQLYNSENNFREDLVDRILQQAVREAMEEDVRYTYQVVPVRLVCRDGKWLAEGSPEFWKAVSGGISETGAMVSGFEMYMNNVFSDALEGILAIDKVYWLQDADTVSPRPDPENYGSTDDPADLEPVLQAAEKLLKGQQTVFRTDTQLMENSQVRYYRDETILAITWQQTENNAIYTCSEVVIAHPSQFRRFLSDGEFGSGKLYFATEMAAGVNAVVASNGDYYGYRGYGNLVYNSEVKMAENRYLDTCYIDSNGDLIMLDFNTVYTMQGVRDFVRENDIRFSLAFGPILVKDGKVVAKHHYPIGETERPFSRAALCQIGPLHYMLVTVNRKGRDVTQFAKYLQQMGVPNAYALDGGQTSTIVMNNELVNPVDYGGQRKTSDIIYFATALPDGG